MEISFIMNKSVECFRDDKAFKKKSKKDGKQTKKKDN